MKLICPVCKISHDKSVGAYNAAMKRCGIIYCGRTCAGVGRRQNKTPEQLKAEKAEYDKIYREKNLERIKKAKSEAFKKDYADNPDKYREQRQKRMPQHIIYCRMPKHRAKEKEARYRRLGQTKNKECLICQTEKRIIEFVAYAVFPDGRNYICKACEDKEEKEMGISLREVLQTIRTALHKHESSLTIRDYTPYPYLIEAHKYSLLLKRLTK